MVCYTHVWHHSVYILAHSIYFCPFYWAYACCVSCTSSIAKPHPYRTHVSRYISAIKAVTYFFSGFVCGLTARRCSERIENGKWQVNESERETETNLHPFSCGLWWNRDRSLTYCFHGQPLACVRRFWFQSSRHVMAWIKHQIPRPIVFRFEINSQRPFILTKLRATDHSQLNKKKSCASTSFNFTFTRSHQNHNEEGKKTSKCRQRGRQYS